MKMTMMSHICERSERWSVRGGNAQLGQIANLLFEELELPFLGGKGLWPMWTPSSPLSGKTREVDVAMS